MVNNKVLILGGSGFIGKNLIVRLNELDIKVVTYTRNNSTQDIGTSFFFKVYKPKYFYHTF